MFAPLPSAADKWKGSQGVAAFTWTTRKVAAAGASAIIAPV
jgi:hypothetical protein